MSPLGNYSAKKNNSAQTKMTALISSVQQCHKYSWKDA